MVVLAQPWIKRAAKVVLGMGGVLAFAAQVGPDDVVSNLSKWLNRLGVDQVPNWLSATRADTIVFYSSIVLVLCSLAVIYYPGLITFLNGSAWAEQKKEIVENHSKSSSNDDGDRPDVHVVEANLVVWNTNQGRFLSSAIELVIRDLGKRAAMNVELRMWLGHDVKPDIIGLPPVISISIRLLEPGPHDARLNNYTQFISGGQDLGLDKLGTYMFPPSYLTIDEMPEPTPPPFNRETYLVGTLEFDDPLTTSHYTKTLCFEQLGGWPNGHSEKPIDYCFNHMKPCQ